MKNICITGISGYLGLRLAKELSTRRDVEKIVGIDIAEFTEKLDNIEFINMDVRNPDFAEILIKNQIDTLFHLAFIVQPIHNIKKMHDIDYNGTLNMLHASLNAGVKHFLVTSSTLAYGAHKDNPDLLVEESPLRGNRSYPYGYNKALVDNMIQEFAAHHKELAVTILRPCTVFGPTVDNYVSRMLFKTITAGFRKDDPHVQFIHEDDFVSACLLAVEKGVSGVFNICGDGTVKTSEIAEMVGTKIIPLPAFVLYPLLEMLWRIHMPGIYVNRGYLDYVRFPFVGDNRKAKAVLGFYPKYSSLDTLEDTIKNRKRKFD